jgi:hypothetical protein
MGGGGGGGSKKPEERYVDSLRFGQHLAVRRHQIL